MKVKILVVVLLTVAIASIAYSNTISCQIQNSSCTGGDVDFGGLWSLNNSHYELYNKSIYTNRICCSLNVGTLDNSCTGSNDNAAFVRVNADTNTHVEKATEATGGFFDVCMGVSQGTVSVVYPEDSGACTGYDACLMTISNTTNAHVGDCGGESLYTTSVCITQGGSQILGDESNVTVSGVNALNVTLDGSDDLTGTYSGEHMIQIYDGINLLANITWDSSAVDFDLSQLTIERSSTGIAINTSGIGGSKDMYLYAWNLQSICVKDEDINTISQITSDCSGSNETLFVIPSGCPGTTNGISCAEVTGGYKFSNLSHSGANGTPNPVPEFSTYALLAVLVLVAGGFLVMRRR